MSAVAVFKSGPVRGEAVASPLPRKRRGVTLRVRFSRVPKGDHGFHIHRAGDLRGEGCAGACAHYHVGAPATHGGPPPSRKHRHTRKKGNEKRNRHTGDLGNIRGPTFTRTYHIPNICPRDLWGRTLIVHADPDDLGRGPHADSHTTGHSGKRIACAIFGRANPCD